MDVSNVRGHWANGGGRPGAVVNAILRTHKVPRLQPPLTVEREVRLTKTERLDIRVTDAAQTVVIIENKVTAIPSAAQLARYRAGLGKGGNVYLLIISTAFDDDVRASLKCEYVGLDELLKVIRPHRRSHFLLEQYTDWLEGIWDRRTQWAQDAISSSPTKYNAALSEPVGQWALLRSLTQGMKGRQYRGMGLGKRPWTQFCFVEQTPQHDALFYRLDRSADGFELTLKQYRDDVGDGSGLGAKQQRLIALRRWWSTALSARAGLTAATLRNAGNMESMVGRFLLYNNSPHRLISILPIIHKAFIRKLRTAGWPVEL